MSSKATNEPVSWKDLIDKYRDKKEYRSRTCRIFGQASPGKPTPPEAACPCGRLVRCHSFDGQSLELQGLSKTPPAFEIPTEFTEGISKSAHSEQVKFNVYGTLESTNCKFLRIDNRCQPANLYQLLCDDCGGKPSVILSVYGGAKFFTITERLEKEFIRGIIDAATMADAWILTTGVNNGVSKLMGEGVSHYRELRENSNRLKCIGMTMWGTIDEATRMELKDCSANYPIKPAVRQLPPNVQENKETIESNHTHCILFDTGRLDDFLSDSQRDRLINAACAQKDHSCYAVTIIVEGGLGSLEVLQNDIRKERPIVLIEGSGRLADFLATLIEYDANADQVEPWTPKNALLKTIFKRFFPGIRYTSVPDRIKQIETIMKENNRHLLHVFSLDRDKNVAETIFKAIFTVITKKNVAFQVTQTAAESEDQERQRRTGEEDKLIDLALKWNYFDGVLPIFQARQSRMFEGSKHFIQDILQRQKNVFCQALFENRPTFIEYFLITGFDPLTLIGNNQLYEYHKFILELYQNSYAASNQSHDGRAEKSFGKSAPTSMKSIDQKLNKFIGAYFHPIYSSKVEERRMFTDLSNHACCCCPPITDRLEAIVERSNHPVAHNHEVQEDKYTKYQVLRDLFLWSILMDMPDMAKVFLFHLRSRICAALVASAIFKTYSSESSTVDLKDRYKLQSLEFETYAAKSTEKCYEHNESRACELLLRQIPAFGNVTCMQVAIASESRKLLETACFDQTLNQVWYNKLSLVNHQGGTKVAQIPSLLTVGLLAPLLVTYREIEPSSRNNDETLSGAGINYYIKTPLKDQSKWQRYWKEVLYFHQSPMVKMCYHFIAYIWFLLVFSYMMLYHLDGRATFEIPHWTEIYVIITISTMFCEEVRKIYHEYKQRMVERWGSTGSAVINVLSNIFYIMPYLLFYLGMGFRYQSYNAGLLSTARIIWALNLELWYLRSLKFVIALKFLGPKLFMLKNMLRDLFAFVYMIFIAISAYGVVSRAMILYNQVPFTGRGIFSEIFYEPYWFIYGEVSDKALLDAQINNNGTGLSEAEATATHVLLAFHMLFINILLLNLLIAVFADSIGKVQENTEFYWRYQRYSFVREYFERVPFAYPPLIFISHLILFFIYLQRRCCRSRVTDQNDNHVPLFKRITPIFKMIPINRSTLDEKWDAFENAATYSYARSALKGNKHKDQFTSVDDKPRKLMTTIDSNVNSRAETTEQSMENLKTELLETVRNALTETQKAFEQNALKTEHRLNQMSKSIEWMTSAMARVKMNDPKVPKPMLELPLTTTDIHIVE